MKSYLIRHLNRDKGATCTFPRGEFPIISQVGQTTVLACENGFGVIGYSLEIYDLTEEIKSKIPAGLKAEDCKIKIHVWQFFDVEGKKQLNLDVVKNKEKEKPVGKPPNLLTNDEIQEALHNGPEYADRFPRKGTTPGKNPSVNPSKGRGITPADTTAPNSRNTQTPVKKGFGGLCGDDLIASNRNIAVGLPSGKSVKSKIFEQTGPGKTTSAKQSLSKPATTFGNSSIPKGLKVVYICVQIGGWSRRTSVRVGTSDLGGKPAGTRGSSMKFEILGINELLDLDIKKFERDNGIKLVPSFHNFRETSAKKEATKSHFESSGAAKKSGLVIPKKKVSEYHFNVGLGKRHQQDVPYSDAFTPKASAKKQQPSAQLKVRLEDVTFKRSILEKYFSQKQKPQK